jgi:hypothetical protein
VLVVADSSPFIYLSRVGALDVLRAAFGEVIVPAAVWAEVVTARPTAPGVSGLRTAAWLRVDGRILGWPRAVDSVEGPARVSRFEPRGRQGIPPRPRGHDDATGAASTAAGWSSGLAARDLRRRGRRALRASSTGATARARPKIARAMRPGHHSSPFIYLSRVGALDRHGFLSRASTQLDASEGPA